jgi:hypothetical protein
MAQAQVGLSERGERLEALGAWLASRVWCQCVPFSLPRALFPGRKTQQMADSAGEFEKMATLLAKRYS